MSEETNYKQVCTRLFGQDKADFNEFIEQRECSSADAVRFMIRSFFGQRHVIIDSEQLTRILSGSEKRKF